MTAVSTVLQKKWVQRAGYAVFALLAFVYALHLTFPYGRIEQRLQDWVGDGFDVRVGSAGPGWFPGDLVLTNVSFKTHPTQEGEKPVEFTIDRVEVDIGLLASMRGNVDIAFDGKVSSGHITGHIVAGKSPAKIYVRSKDVPLENLPGIRTVTGGVPMAGGLEAKMDITLPKKHWREANGVVELACNGCTIGDGVAKIRPQAPGQQSAFSDGGFTLPKLKLGKLGGKLQVAKGIGKFVDFEGKSPDGEISLEGDIRFEDPFVRSQVTAYLKFKASDQLKAREPVMADIENLMKGASLRPDGYMGVKMTGPLNALRYLGSKISPVPEKDSGAGPTRPGGMGMGMGGMGAGRPFDDAADRPMPQVQLPPTPPPSPPPPAVDVPPPSPPPPTPAPVPESTGAVPSPTTAMPVRQVPAGDDVGGPRPSDGPDQANPPPQPSDGN
jgi:type II secretion system protein N